MFNDLVHGSVIRLQGNGFRGDLDFFGDLAQLELHIHTRFLLRLDMHAGNCGGLETGHLHRKGVVTERYGWKRVVARRAGDCGTDLARPRSSDGDLSSRDSRPNSVADEPQDLGRLCRRDRSARWKEGNQ